jgi:hypothetical protein
MWDSAGTCEGSFLSGTAVRGCRVSSTRFCPCNGPVANGSLNPPTRPGSRQELGGFSCVCVMRRTCTDSLTREQGHLDTLSTVSVSGHHPPQTAPTCLMTASSPVITWQARGILLFFFLCVFQPAVELTTLLGRVCYCHHPLYIL